VKDQVDDRRRGPAGGLRPARRRSLALLAAGALAAAALAGAGAALAGGAGPDVTLIHFTNVEMFGAVGGVRAYAVGYAACNVGDQPIDWCNDNGEGGCGAGTTDDDHPVMAQNLYRLKEGRFEHIGMSWIKHGFGSSNETDPECGAACEQPPLGQNQLGVGCTDAYNGFINGIRPLARHSDINPATGTFPYPYPAVPAPDLTSQRLRVAESDLDPALNPGAIYFLEGHYVAADDAAAGNAMNNASYQPAVITPTYQIELAGAAVREQPAIAAWKAVDSAVDLAAVDVPGSSPVERFHVGRLAYHLGGGLWRYEYAVHNYNSDRAARSLTVDFPGAATISNVGFHDIDHHSGEIYATTDWTADLSTPGQVTWSTDVFATDPNANALRWSTVFSFWFDATAGPAGIAHTLGLFKPGSPATVAFTIESRIFADDFESGGTGAWSSTVEE
jgi:hypothetical protein